MHSRHIVINNQRFSTALSRSEVYDKPEVAKVYIIIVARSKKNTCKGTEH